MPLSELPRPSAPRRSALAVVALIAAFVGISTTTGTGWPLVLVSILAGCLVAGFVLPPLFLVRAGVELRLPADADAGRPFRVAITANHAGSAAVDVPELETGWIQGRGGTLAVTVARRGVIAETTVDLWSTAPLGLWSWRRRIVRPVAAPLHVAPCPAALSAVDLRTLTGAGDELTRGVRPYRSGDDRRHVHWPATAREGELMVRETEAAACRRVLLVGELGRADHASAELAEARAAWLQAVGAALLDAGVSVGLVTVETDRVVTGDVRSARELGRRLARATVGGVGVLGADVEVVDVRRALP